MKRMGTPAMRTDAKLIKINKTTWAVLDPVDNAFLGIVQKQFTLFSPDPFWYAHSHYNNQWSEHTTRKAAIDWLVNL